MPNETQILDKVTVDVDFPTIGELAKIPVDIINNILTGLFPGYEIWIIGIIAFIVAYLLKRKGDKSVWWAILVAILIFAALRYFGIGG